MSGLAHYLEDEGLATILISLIREHSEKMKPPRALWVPFDLGRPLGMPGRADFQKEVLRAVLALLEREKGPVHEDYPHEAEKGQTEAVLPACPVNFGQQDQDMGELEKLLHSFQSELQTMRTWHDLADRQQERTSMGVSGLEPEEITGLFSDFLEGRARNDDVRLSDLLRMAAEDIKAFYCEAITAQPGQTTDAGQLADWFWGQTHAALVINEIRKQCLRSEEKDMLLAGKLLLVPRSQVHRFERE